VSDKLRLGALVDVEYSQKTNGTATGDDLDGSDDEDGVQLPATMTLGETVTIPVTVTNTSDAPVFLNAWIDYNNNGNLSDAGEQIANNITVPKDFSDGLINIVTTIPESAVTDTNLGIRFRLTSSSSPGSTGSLGGNGEVEDYPFPINQVNLPVELVNFKGELKEDKTTLLTWSTASELNNDYFDVQRKKQDGSGWENIGQIDGFGNSSKLISYSFIDKNPNTGENYYRLNQVDFDGKSEYSPTIMVKLDGATTETKDAFIIYPNPVRNEIWIKSEKEIVDNQNILLEVFDVSGQKVFASMMDEREKRLDLSEYQRGIYLIKVGTKTYKILKQ